MKVTDDTYATNTNEPNKKQAIALKQLIAKQRALGAKISEDITNEIQYTWDENGNL